MVTNFWLQMRAANIITMLGAAGSVRVELLDGDFEPTDATMDYEDIEDNIVDYPGYVPSGIVPGSYSGPVQVGSKWVVSTFPLIFTQIGVGGGPVEAHYAALIIRIAGDLGPEDHLLMVEEIPDGPWVFEDDGDANALSYRIETDECDADGGGGGGGGDGDPPPSGEEGYEILWTDDEEDILVWEDEDGSPLCWLGIGGAPP